MRIICAVGLIVRAQSTDRILVVEERHSKPEIGKKAGMLSIPLETMKKGEVVRKTLGRLISEEVGRKSGLTVASCREMEGDLPEFSYGDEIFSFIRLYQTVVPTEFVAAPESDDVVYHGWMSPENFVAIVGDGVRQEASQIVEEYINERNKVFVSAGFPAFRVPLCP